MRSAAVGVDSSLIVRIVGLLVGNQFIEYGTEVLGFQFGPPNQRLGASKETAGKVDGVSCEMCTTTSPDGRFSEGRRALGCQVREPALRK